MWIVSKTLKLPTLFQKKEKKLKNIEKIKWIELNKPDVGESGRPAKERVSLLNYKWGFRFQRRKQFKIPKHAPHSL